MELELREASMMQRLWSGITSRGASGNPIIALDVIIPENAQDHYILTLSADNMLRLWSVQRRQCVAVHTLPAPERSTSSGNE